MDPIGFQAALRDPDQASASLDELVNDWNSRLSEAIDEIAPRRLLPSRSKTAPWYTGELRKMKRELRKLERVWRRTRDEATRTPYRHLLRAYEVAMKAAKKDFYAASIASASSRPAQLFRVIRSLTSLPQEHKNISRLGLSCEAFASFFADKILSLRHALPATVDTISELEAHWPSSGPHMDHFSPLSLEEVDRIFSSSRPTTCPLDPCPSWLVKASGAAVLPSLRNIINQSLTTGVFPRELKEAVVRPLLKKPTLDPQVLVNYRPVSNLPFLGKLIERAAEKQLAAFLEETSSFDPFQSGFWPGYGTETALVALTDDLRRHLDQGGSALLLLLDLSAAFDVVDFDLLTHRLAGTGIQGTALQWLVSFLHDRGQRVALGEELSQRHPLLCGVPQGAILSPMLFNIYMRPLAQVARRFGLGCHQYADDTQLYLLMDGHARSVPDSLADALEAVAGWLKRSRLKLNPAKTEVLWLNRGGLDTCPRLPTLDGATLQPQPLVKSLGVTLDPSLSMEVQVSAAAKTAFFHLRQIRQLAPFLSTSDLATVIHALVTSRLDYCNSLYAGLPLGLTRRLQLVQNAAARLLSGAPLRAHIQPVLRQLHWLPVVYRIRFKVLTLTFKALCGLGPSYLQDRLLPYTPQRALRSADQRLLVIPGPRDIRLASTRARAFSALAPTWWNQLPDNIRALRDFLAFRRACKTELFRQAFG